MSPNSSIQFGQERGSGSGRKATEIVQTDLPTSPFRELLPIERKCEMRMPGILAEKSQFLVVHVSTTCVVFSF